MQKVIVETLRELSSRYPHPGRVVGIFVRPARGEPVLALEQVNAIAGQGLAGDRAVKRVARTHAGSTAKARHLSLLQAELLPVLEAWTGRSPLGAGLLRRNILVSGLNLGAMRSPFADASNRWVIGNEVIIEITGPCEPCSKMEQVLGAGGYNMMRGNGGLTAAIISGGLMTLGDLIRPAPD